MTLEPGEAKTIQTEQQGPYWLTVTVASGVLDIWQFANDNPSGIPHYRFISGLNTSSIPLTGDDDQFVTFLGNPNITDTTKAAVTLLGM